MVNGILAPAPLRISAEQTLYLFPHFVEKNYEMTRRFG